MDVYDENSVPQNVFNERLRIWAQPRATDKKEKVEFVETLEFVVYLVCAESNITQQSFRKIFGKIFMKQILKVFGDERKMIDIDLLMAFIMETTNYNEVDVERLNNIHQAFLNHFGREKTVIGYDEFKKIIPSKDDFFVKRLFNLFDCDQSNSISISEFCETINAFYSEGEDSKLEFLFYIYDVNYTGKLYKNNFVEVIKACMKEGGLKLDQKQVSDLAEVLFEDGVKEGKDYMSCDDFKDQLRRQEGLINNLNTIIDNLIIPKKTKPSKPLLQVSTLQEKRRYFTTEYWNNNKPLIFAILALVLLMVVVTIERCYYFSRMTMVDGSTPNLFYMLSRSAGKNILALSVIVIMLVLRNTITLLRNLGVGRFLPLDNNIYLHKVVGVLIFVLGMVHSLCHLLNFAINIQPDPVKYLLMTYKYWQIHFGDPLKVYHAPESCFFVTENDTSFNCSKPAGLSVGQNISYPGPWLCQVGPDCQPWSYTDWLLTTRPGLFGLLPGWANPTGVGLMATMIVIFTCSLPFVRRRGHFEVFYFSHYLYLLYYLLLILHAPQFYMWFLPIGIIWLGEKIFRVVHSYMGKGRTFIEEGVVLPSKVTNLIIKRPLNFTFRPGDWVFVRIPR